MNRVGSWFWLGLAMSTCVAMFMVKYAVQSLDDELARVKKQTVSEQLEIRVLHAEWSYLTQPERLAELNKQFLSLAPIATKQLQQSIVEIPLRTMPDPPVEVSASASSPPAPQPPLGLILPAGNLPVTPAALNSAAPAPPLRGIDALFAETAAPAAMAAATPPAQPARAAVPPNPGIDALFAQIAAGDR